MLILHLPLILVPLSRITFNERPWLGLFASCMPRRPNVNLALVIYLTLIYPDLDLHWTLTGPSQNPYWTLTIDPYWTLALTLTLFLILILISILPLPLPLILLL